MDLRRLCEDCALAALAQALRSGGGPDSSAEASAGCNGWRVVVTVAGPDAPPPPEEAPPPPPVPALALAQRLTAIEQCVVEVLLACAPVRRSSAELRDLVEARMGVRVGEGTLRFYLSRLANSEVGILDNDRCSLPPGYGVTAAYRDFLEWARCDGSGSR